MTTCRCHVCHSVGRACAIIEIHGPHVQVEVGARPPTFPRLRDRARVRGRAPHAGGFHPALSPEDDHAGAVDASRPPREPPRADDGPQAAHRVEEDLAVGRRRHPERARRRRNEAGADRRSVRSRRSRLISRRQEGLGLPRRGGVLEGHGQGGQGALRRRAAARGLPTRPRAPRGAHHRARRGRRARRERAL